MNDQVNYAKIQRIQDNLEALVIGQFGTGFCTDAMLYESGIKSTVAQHTSQLADITKMPEQYGAVGDGVADDTAPIQNMVNDCITNGYNMQLNKKYKTTSLVTINGQGKKVNFIVNGIVTAINDGFLFTNIYGGKVTISLKDGGTVSSVGVKFTYCRHLDVDIEAATYGGLVLKMGGKKDDNTDCQHMKISSLVTESCYQALEHGDSSATNYQTMFGAYEFILDSNSTNGIVFQKSCDITIKQLENHFTNLDHTKNSVNILNCVSLHFGNLAIGGQCKSLLYVTGGNNVSIDKFHCGNEDGATKITNGMDLDGFNRITCSKILDVGCAVVVNITNSIDSLNADNCAIYDFTTITRMAITSSNKMIVVDGVDLGFGQNCSYSTKSIQKYSLLGFTNNGSTAYYDNGLNASYQKIYKVGDTIYNNAPVVGGNIGWVCTGAGYIVGSIPVWASSTAYTVNSSVQTTVDGNTRVYICAKGGTSGTTTPSGTSTFNDNGVVWYYVNATATFIPFGIVTDMNVLINTQWSDFLQRNSCPPWSSAAIASGTFSDGTGNVNHKGVVVYSSSTSANSGYKYYIGTSNIVLGGSEKSNIIFSTASTLTGVTRRMGFHNGTDQNDAVDGVYIEIVDGVLSGKTANNSVRSTTGTTYTLSSGTYYKVKIELNSTSTKATFTLYNESGTVLWTNSLTTNITTTRPMGHGDICTYSGTSAITIGYLDYMDIYIPSRRILSQ